MFRFNCSICIIIMIERIKKAVENLPRIEPLMTTSARLRHIMTRLRATEKARYTYLCLSLG